MELLHLKYFTYVAEYLNYTVAAQKLYISQPALSMTIKKLENELNTQLFIKKGRSIQLTDSGQLLLESAHTIFKELSQVTDIIHENESMRLHTVRFATSSSRFMMTIFDQFIDQYPDNNFNIDIISNSEMIQKLLFQHIHFTLNTMALTHPHIHCKQIITEDIVLTYPKYLDGQHIDLRDPDLYKSFLFSSQNTEFNRMFKEVLSYKHISVDNENYVDDHFMSSVLSKRNNFSFLPISSCRDLNLPYIEDEEFIFNQPIYLSTLKDMTLNPANEAFFKFIENYLIEHESYFKI
ncbi:LysR family transcriptional regulator [Staphylococcus warneri]|uniref:LysR family transcriptional regulator n=1 Tax=Staphylococcus warneri TaxID=1292 RepID=UPI003CF018C0